MKEMKGYEYKKSEWAKATFASDAKVGKSCYLVAGALGLLPWQSSGGIVDKPEALHVITYDTDALGGVMRFLVESLNAPKEALNFNVYNLEDDLRSAMDSDEPGNMVVYNATLTAVSKARDKMKEGSHVVLFSSATMMANGIERGVMGAPNGKAFADVGKWKMLQAYLTEIQMWGHKDGHHTMWETHIDKSPPNPQIPNDTGKEFLTIAGKAGRNWGVNCSWNARLRRNFGTLYVKNGVRTKVEETYIDVRGGLNFNGMGGRGVTEALDAKEADITVAFQKLGLKTGNWGAK
jgi:hypothetical protein